MRYFPLFADLRGRRVLVVGGGEVAERKIRLLLEAQASVTVVAPGVTHGITTLVGAGAVTRIDAYFREGHLEGMVLVIAATDDRALNARVAAVAQMRNVLANAQLISDRLTGVPDPTVQRLAPKLIASLDRANS